MTTATPQAGRVAVTRQSQGALVAREFRKRRLAVVAAFIILVLVSISIFAPLLAHDRPIYYVGINRFEFREAGKNARGLIGQLAGPGKDFASAAVQGQIRSVQLQFDLMLAELPSESAPKLADVRDRLNQVFADPDRSQTPARLRAIQSELRPLIESLEPKLVARSRWPVIQSLQWSDLGFMVANILLLACPLWARWLAPQSSEAGPRRTATVLLIVPLISMLMWWWLVPRRVDRTDYKTGVLLSDDTDHKANVVYQTVMWPPVAYGIDEYDLSRKSVPPVWYPESWRSKATMPRADSTKRVASRWNTPHWLGTDEAGRDVFCRMIWGGRVSLSVGFVAVGIYVVIGVVVGSLAGYFRGTWDLILSRLIEVVICFPSFFLILTIVAMVGPGLLNIMVVIGLTGWTGIARLVRGEFLRLVDQEFVLAGRALGYSPTRLIFRHVLPNAMAPVLVSATFGVAGAILTESALSFLGLGIQAPIPSWGSLLFDGRSVMDHAPWLIHFPGLAIFLTITSYNLVGEALRDAADPRLRGSR